MSEAATFWPRAVFLDRDGTLIRDTGYVADPDDVELLPRAADGLRLLNEAGVPAVIVTNQSGIGRGYFSLATFEAVQSRVESLLFAEGARVDGVYFCPHAPEEGCECRKPGLGLYRLAAAELGVEMAGALYVGDRARDVLPAQALTGMGMLVAGEGGEYDGPVPADVLRVPDLFTGLRRLGFGRDDEA
ncbi:MAG: HAD family hydrolase [Gemmatimonadetes bacterium]|nr:HAD family hydrolase [Gemmatimonadota bacterium]